MTLYRIELDEQNGLWYDKNAHFFCKDKDLIKLPMPEEKSIYKGVYKSACANLQDILYWIPLKAQKRLKKAGYKLVKYETNDYFYREHGEVCFNKTNYISRIIIEEWLENDQL